MSKEKENVDLIASAIEDLFNMEIIEFRDNEKIKEPFFSIKFANIFSVMVSERKPMTKDDFLKILYHSFFIYLYEHLNLPKNFIIKLSEDLDNTESNMKCKDLVIKYVLILYDILENGKTFNLK